MAERGKSREDAALEALFRCDAVPDNGFTLRVVARLRRRLWLRRLLVPAAAIVGGLVAVQPASTLLTAMIESLLQSSTAVAPLLQPAPVLLAAAIPGALLAAGLAAALRMLD